MSWLSSIFTAPGTSDRNDWLNAQKTAAGYAQSILPAYADWIKYSIPQARQASNQLYQYTTQPGRESLVNSYWNQAMGRAGQTGANAQAAYAGNPALASAFKLGSYNTANQGTNNYANQINSPIGQLGALESWGNSLGVMNPMFSGLNALKAASNYQAPPVGQSPLASLAPVIGTAIGGPWGALLGGSGAGLFGGGRSGGSDPYTSSNSAPMDWAHAMAGWGNGGGAGASLTPGDFSKFDLSYFGL